MQPAQQIAATPLTARERRIAAAVSAAETFNAGRASMFDSARVTGSALKFALQQMVERTLNNTAGVSDQSTVRVMFLGDGPARVKHDWYGVDSRNLRKVTAVIVLPDFADDAILPRAFCDEYTAFCIHELAHIVYTNPHAFRRGIVDVARNHRLSESQAQGIINALEDVRIERALMRDGVAVGFRGVVAGLLGRMMGDAVKAGALDAFRSGDASAFGFGAAYALRKLSGVCYVPGGEAIRAAMTPAHRAVLDYAEAMLAGVTDDNAGTDSVVRIADECIARLGLTKDGKCKPGDEPGDEPGDKPGDKPGDGPSGPADGPEGRPCPEGTPGDTPGGDKPADGPGDTPGDGPAGDKPGDTPGDKPAATDKPATDGPSGPAGEAGEQSKADTPGTPGTSAVGGAAADKPKAWTFSAEPVPVAVPAHAKVADGTSEVFPPVVTPAAKPDDGGRKGARVLAEAMTGFARAGALATSLRRLFSRTDRESLETGRRSGKVRAASLARVRTGAQDIFARRTAIDGVNSACSILIDGSGSMGPLSREANKAVAVLVKVLSSCPGVKTSVAVFQGAGYSSNIDNMAEQAAVDAGIMVRGETVRLRMLKDFADSPATAYGALGEIYASGGTPDNAAVRGAGKILARRSEGRKVLLVIVDGGTNRHDAMRAEVDALARQGVLTIAVGIGMTPSKKAFPHSASVSSVADLGGEAFRAMLDAVRRADAGRV